MHESILYRILRPLIVFFIKVFIRPTYIGLNNIPIERVLHDAISLSYQDNQMKGEKK